MQPLTCCTACGSDTRNKSGICSDCYGRKHYVETKAKPSNSGSCGSNGSLEICFSDCEDLDVLLDADNEYEAQWVPDLETLVDCALAE